MTDKQEKPKRKRKKPPEKKRLEEQQTVTMDQIFPGFAEWYKRSYDADGNLLPSARIPGLTPPTESESEEE